jgi:S1-C subfamily serine protease
VSHLIRPTLAGAAFLTAALLFTVQGQEKAAGARAYLGLAGEPGGEGGVVVRKVSANGPAAQAGLKAGDVITRVDGQQIKGFEDLADAVTRCKPGDKVKLTVRQGGAESEMVVTLAPRPDRLDARQPAGPPFLGVQTQPLTADLQQRFGVKSDKGVVITEVVPGSPAAKAGLKEQDVITGVDAQPITGPQDLRDAVQKAGAGREVTLKVERGAEAKEVRARLEAAPGFGGQFPGLERPGVPPGFATDFIDTPAKVRALEQTVRDLEKRVRELEQRLEQKK